MTTPVATSANSGPPRKAGRHLRNLLVLAVTLGLLSALVRFGPSTAPGRALIVGALNGMQVGDLGRLRIQGLQGDPLTDFTLARVEISDRHGVWLNARNVAVRWRAADLWWREARINSLTVGAITLVRRPERLPGHPGPGGAAPVSIRVDRVSALVTLMPDFAWRRGDYLVDGAADIARAGAASGNLRAVSLAHPGDFLRASFKFNHDAITLEAHAREATGGALAGSLGLDPNKPFVLDARAHGTPKAGWFSLASAVGATAPATAAGQWSPAGGEASGRLDLTASRWLTPWRARLGPEAIFHLTAARESGNLYRLGLEARGGKLGLTASGDVDPARLRTGPAGVAVSVEVSDLSALVGAPGLGPARAAGRLVGDMARWRLAGQASADRLQAPGFSLARIAGSYQLQSDRSGLVLRGEVLGSGGSGLGPAASLLGPAPRGSGEIDWLTGGPILLRRLQVRGAALDVDGQGERGLLGGLSFKGEARIHDLAAVARGDRGQASVDWRASQTRATVPWTFNLSAHGEGLRLASTEATGLLGPTPTLTADGRFGVGGLTVDRATLRGGAGSLNAVGAVGSAGDLRLKLDWTAKGPISIGPLTVSGPSEGGGDLEGTLERPRLDLRAVFKVIDLPDLGDMRIRDARLDLNLETDGQGLSGRFTLGGAGDHGPAKADAAFRFNPDEVSLSDIAVDLGGATIRGSGALKDGQPTLADLTFAVDPGAFLARGHAEGRIQITPSADGARARVSLKGAGLALPDDGPDLDTVTLSADGPLRRLPYQIEARGDAAGLRGRLSGAGFISDDKGDPVASFTGAGRVGAADVHTLAPAEMSFGRSGAAGSLHLAVGQGGRADVTFTQSAATLNGHAVVADLELGLFDASIVGRADGVLTFTRLGDSLVGSTQAHVAGLAARDLAGSSSLSGSFDATFGSGAVALRTQLAGPKGSTLAVDLHLPATLSAEPLALAIDTRRPISGRFTANGDIGPAWDLLVGGAQGFSGRVVASGTIGGTLADPLLTGTAALDDGDFEDAGVGLRLKNIALRAALSGDAIDVSQFGATDGAKGALSGSGRLSLLREGASSFRLTLKGFRLIDAAEGQATASGNVDVARGADGKVKLGGALVIDRAQISTTPPTPSGVVPMEVVEIHQAADSEDFGPAPPSGREPPIDLDITLKAPRGLFLRGRGLNMELSLDAKVSGTTAAPELSGVARVVRGDYDFAGQRFQVVDTGSVRLGSTPDTIHLDLTATRDDPTLTAVIKIQGTAAHPTLTLSSTPPLPKDEILSQVLFGTSAAQLSGLQAAQLASALAGMAGGGGFDVIGGLRSFAHLDRLAIDTNATTGVTVAGGKYLADRIYVEFSNSARLGQGAQVEWRAKKHLSIVSQVTDQGDHAISVRWRKDY